MTTNGTEIVKASGVAKLDIAAVRKQRVAEQNGERVFVPSVTRSKFDLHSTSCQNRKAKILGSQQRFHQNAQIYDFHD